jgi:hypothetical protein
MLDTIFDRFVEHSPLSIMVRGLMERVFLAVIRRVLGSVHGVGKIESSLSEFYLVDEIQGTYRGMTIAIAPVHWQSFNWHSLPELATLFLALAARVNLKSFLKQPRRPKKKNQI